eukprot:14533543-Heterocapsa_arctica.AAC.1
MEVAAKARVGKAATLGVAPAAAGIGPGFHAPSSTSACTAACGDADVRGAQVLSSSSASTTAGGVAEVRVAP